MPAKPLTRIGIFGGTFDPIHFGHLRVAEEAREYLELDRVLLIPAADPPHKQRRAITPAAHRIAMLRLAIRGHTSFRASSIEIDRPGLSFTIDTLRQLRRTHPGARLVLLVGLDTFLEIDTWKEYPQLFEMGDIAVLSRPGSAPQNDTSRSIPKRSPKGMLPVAVRGEFRYGHNRETLLHRNGNRVSFLSVTALDIAATDIRARAMRGRSIRYLVPSSVERYIARERLYRNRAQPRSIRKK